jgi:hypothetical protein
MIAAVTYQDIMCMADARRVAGQEAASYTHAPMQCQSQYTCHRYHSHAGEASHQLGTCLRHLPYQLLGIALAPAGTASHRDEIMHPSKCYEIINLGSHRSG